MCLSVQSVIRYAAGAGAVVLALALSTASAAANTIDLRAEYLDSSYVNRATCDFPIRVHEFGSYKVTDFYDGDGTLYKETISSGGGGIFTITDSAKGTTLTMQMQSARVEVDFNPDGSVDKTTTDGLAFRFTSAGDGVVLLDTGRLVTSAEGDVIWSAGPHQFRVDGDVATFCAAFG
jgi:hypothetical protein